MRKLGFGLMRLPRTGDNMDTKRSVEFIDKFMENGFTYFDLAYAYKGSEVAFKEMVVDRYPRDSYTVADKMPVWFARSEEDVENMFNTSMERCGVEFFDYYLLHSITRENYEFYDKYDVWNFAKQKKAEGKIKNLGFSFHADPELLDNLLTIHPDIDFVQLQINYLDWESETVFSRKNYEICRKHNKPVIIMEPVKGGLLADLGPEAGKIFDDLNPDASYASYALRFAGSLDGVFMVLSGMSDEIQTADNIRTFYDFKPLTDIEREAIDKVRESILKVPAIPCTGCGYCTPGCPMGISIPSVFSCYNDIYKKASMSKAKDEYKKLVEEGESAKATECISCGQCEGVCPQHLGIIDLLEKCSEKLEK